MESKSRGNKRGGKGWHGGRGRGGRRIYPGKKENEEGVETASYGPANWPIA